MSVRSYNGMEMTLRDIRLTKIKQKFQAAIDAREAGAREEAEREQRKHTARVQAEQAWPLKRQQLEVLVEEINRELADVNTQLAFFPLLRTDDRLLDTLEIAYANRRGSDPSVSIVVTTEGLISAKAGIKNAEPRTDTYTVSKVTAENWRDSLYTFLEFNLPPGS